MTDGTLSLEDEKVDIRGHRFLVTGGASGIGAELVRMLLERGNEVVVLDLPSQLQLIESFNVHRIPCDLSDFEAIDSALQAAWDAVGGFDRAVLSAGVGAFVPMRSLAIPEWNRVIGVNLTGTFITMRAALTLMEDAGIGGSIVAVSSTSSQLTERGFGHYGASKAGLNHLVRIAAAEFGASGIRVNAIAPGVTHSPMFDPTKSLPGYWDQLQHRTPLKRIGVPHDIAEAILAILELNWVTGQILVVDGGLSLFSPVDFSENRTLANEIE